MSERKLKFIVMTTGYVENASISPMIFQCKFFGHPGYSTYREAITELALDMYAKFYTEQLSVYENRYSSDFKQCCRDTFFKDTTAKYCMECGHHLLDKKFDEEEFMEFVSNLSRNTTDSYGEAEATKERNFAWWPYWIEDFIGTSKEEVIFIGENGEGVILAALLDSKPELKGTSDLDEDFSFRDWEKFKREEQPSYH